MATVILSFIILALVITGMAIGVILQGKPIKGSCGGIASLGMGQACDICGGDQQKCDDNKKQLAKEKAEKKGTFYEA